LIHLHLNCDDRGMSSDGKIDYRGQAMAAMKMAVAANGFERLKWIRVAQAWHDLGRRAEDRDRAASGTCAALAERD
jgi:hypothetical protein